MSENGPLERDRLNDYVEALHHRHGNGLTVFEAIGLASRQAPIRLSWDRMDARDAETRESLRRLTRELGEVAPRVRDPGALCLVEEPEGGWSNAWTRELTEAAAALEDLLPMAIDARTRMARAVGQMAGADPSMLEPLARAILSEAQEDRATLGGRDPAEIQVEAETLREVLRGLDTAEGRLSVPYAARDLARVPVAQIDADWRRAEASIWPLSLFRKGAVRRMLSSYAQGKANPAHDLTHIEEVQDGLAALDQHRLAGLPDWRGRDTDADALDAVAERVATTNVAARAASVEAPAGAGRAEAKALVEAFDAMAPVVSIERELPLSSPCGINRFINL